MAMVCFLIRSNGVLGLQHPFPPPCLPLQALQHFLLAPRLCWHFPYDCLLILCSHILRLLLQPNCPILLHYHHKCVRYSCHYHPPHACSFFSSLPIFQGYSVLHHRDIRGDSCSTCSFRPLGQFTNICISWS